ncbi:MAG: DUF3596 domain-containing protein [Ignavibacteria bacterium]|nr:DUF3596 domain-containing protein [Ignavibacteria bacterium]
MASVYKKRGSYHIAYFVHGKRKHLNTKLKDTKENRSKANKIKADIEREIESIAKSTEINFVNLVSADRNIALKEAEEICLKERFLGKSKSHQDTRNSNCRSWNFPDCRLYPSLIRKSSECFGSYKHSVCKDTL